MSRFVDAWRRRRGYAGLPWGIDLLLTDGCNLRCSYCPIWGDDAVVPAPANFMDTGAALRFIAEVAAFRPMIRLFGGEPFIHPEWRQVVAGARDAPSITRFISNPILTFLSPRWCVITRKPSTGGTIAWPAPRWRTTPSSTHEAVCTPA